MCFAPLSDFEGPASFPHELLPSIPPLVPPEPIPILELQELQSSSLLLIIPILVRAEWSLVVGDFTLKPSLLHSS